MTTRYFSDRRWPTKALFRRRVNANGLWDDVFTGGNWQPTNAVGRWMVGDNDYLDETTETEARAAVPAAFS